MKGLEVVLKAKPPTSKLDPVILQTSNTERLTTPSQDLELKLELKMDSMISKRSELQSCLVMATRMDL